ncbi:MAG: ankyrin repeat domain-containing protein [Rhodoferax sp.]|nr:ankyrin repeat domain-containing protein [Rhodoferax sp.]
MNWPHFGIRKHIKNVIYLYVLIGFSLVHSGSFEDFFTAVKRDDATQVSALLKIGFDPNTSDPAGVPGLMLAMKESSFNVVKVLLSHPKIKVEVRNVADENPLMLAALKGEKELCQLMIQKGADVNKPGWAPLHYAATNGHLEVVRLLLDEHAYIDAASPNNTTPLMMAAQYGTPAAVKLLLEAGADPWLRNDLGLTAIDFASRAGRTDSGELIATFIRGRQPKGSW